METENKLYQGEIEIKKVTPTLEESYPHFNRLAFGWKLLGFKTNENTNTSTPVWGYTWPEKSRYSGEKLRELRKERGVGKRKKA